MLHRLIHLIRLEAGGKVMLRLNNINLDKNDTLLFLLGGSNDKDHPPFEIIDASCWFSIIWKISPG
jgi:hypothetical protein